MRMGTEPSNHIENTKHLVELCLPFHALPDSSRVMPWLAQEVAGRITSKTQNTRCIFVCRFMRCLTPRVMPWLGARATAQGRKLPLRMGTEPLESHGNGALENTKHSLHENNFVCRFMRCLTHRG